MTPKQIQQMKQDLLNLEQSHKKVAEVNSVLKHIGAKGRCDATGNWQNNYNCKLQAAIQYTEGGQNYWSTETLNKEFAQTIAENFQMLLDKTVQRVNLEYQKQLSNFDKYKVDDNA